MFTATLLYLPLGVWMYVAAAQDAVLTGAEFVVSLVLGVVLMALAIGMLMLGKRFGYPDA